MKIALKIIFYYNVQWVHAYFVSKSFINILVLFNGTVPRDFRTFYIKKLYLGPEQEKSVSRIFELRSNIFAITIKFAKPCLSLHMRPRSNLLSKKWSKISRHCPFKSFHTKQVQYCVGPVWPRETEVHLWRRILTSAQPQGMEDDRSKKFHVFACHPRVVIN